MTSATHIRNLAIIAHIDHGKTTLIDAIFQAAHLFRDNEQVANRLMDSYELERERGITIRAKHCTVNWRDYLINIIDTPGHADFSGEVERVLSMVDSVLLLVDANEGPMPQTRYVLMRALRLGLRPIVIINKVDRPNARPLEALNKTFDLFIELGATDEQAHFPVLYGSGLAGWLVRDLAHDAHHQGIDALFETIIEHVPAPKVDSAAPFLMQISTLAWSDYIGQIGCGRVLQGRLDRGGEFTRVVTRWRKPGDPEAGWEEIARASERGVHMWVTRGLERVEVDSVSAGDIVWIAGPEEIGIGDTFAAAGDEATALKPLDIEEPTVSMFFLVNSGPFSGKEGKAIMLRQLKERLQRECRTNVALRYEDIGRADGVKVSGRGELHLAILIEEMRREGLELCVSRPEVITHIGDNGAVLEPMEQLIIDVPEEYQGVVMEKVARRKGEIVHMENNGAGLARLEFAIPTRGLIGYRTDFLTDTRGLGIMASRFSGYGPWKGEIASRFRGSLVSMETGAVTAYQMEKLQERAVLFVEPMQLVYQGQIVGENSRPDDLPCNPTKSKALTNHRAASKDQSVVLNAPRLLTLDQALEWIAEDELVEVTPKSIRMRKVILDAEERKRTEKRRQASLQTT
ncbi:MAG TPA: translational GTPase TypA [bacterium]|nr:translational GTPase TypA [bacterium]